MAKKVSQKQVNQEIKKLLEQYYYELKQIHLSDKIQKWLEANTLASDQAKKSLRDYYQELNRGTVSPNRLTDIETALNDIDQSQKSLSGFQRFLKQWSQDASAQIHSFLSSSLSFGKLVEVTSQAINELKEVDTLLKEIGKSNTALSSSDLKQIGSNSFEIASKYGQKATDYLVEVREASNAGYAHPDELAELTLAAQSASDITAELAGQYLFTVDKAYQLGGSVKALTEVLDGSNSITNHQAVTMTELANGMLAISTQASNLGVNIQETVAALGTLMATTQQSSPDLAKAFEEILLYLKQMTDETAGIDIYGLLRYEQACQALNVSLRETQNGVSFLRNPMEVLGELSQNYTSLEAADPKRTELLNSVGGSDSLRADALDALLNHYSLYTQMLTQYTQGTGSLAADAEKTANSWDGALTRISNTWTDTIGNLTDSSAIAGGLNFLNDLLSILNQITDSLGSLPPLLTGITGLAGIFGTSIVKNFA